MNFIDYLIETKNYSAIKTINEYTKSFGLCPASIEEKMALDKYRNERKKRLMNFAKSGGIQIPKQNNDTTSPVNNQESIEPIKK